MLIQIVRTARLALSDADVQTLEVGEIYTVAPAIGSVLVADGWARAVEGGTLAGSPGLDVAHDEGQDDPEPNS